MADLIIGKNACLEALRSGRKIRGVLLQKRGKGNPGRTDAAAGSPPDGALKGIAELAAERGVPVEYREKRELDRLADGIVHQGVIARAEEYRYSNVEDILALAEEKGETPFLILLDGIEDPHNLGAILRTAECAGAHGVIIPKNRAAAVNETVRRTSAGAAEYVRVAQVTNLSSTIEELKRQGVWIYACDMDGSTCWDMDLTGPLAIVIGSEGRGISRLVREKCDFVLSIPLAGEINSLNASNAAAVIMYEAVRQRIGG